jgi:tRNA threonylcarbamoyladenosine biosynthesis protein TsaB
MEPWRSFLAIATTRYDHTAVLTLALDTTTRAGSVAVMRGDTALAVVAGDASRTHGERLPGELDRALADAGVAATDLQLLAVASGPGAFTGLRIGLAAMQGLAMVLAIPVVAVSALDALALAVVDARRADDHTIAAWMDAQRGEIFAAHYARESDHTRAPHPLAVPIVARPDVVLEQLPGDTLIFTGDGATHYRAEILQRRESAQIVQAPAALALYIARIGQQLAERGAAGPPHALQPLYVRRSDAELERQRRGGV